MKSTKAADKKILKEYLEKLKQIQECGHVNYMETANEKASRISKAKKDYGYFVSYYFPHLAEQECADFHIQEANLVVKKTDFKGVEEWARGLAKSMHFDTFIPIWLHLFHNQLQCMVLVGNTLEAAKKLLSDLQAEFTANPQLLHDFGDLTQHGSWATGNFKTTTGLAAFALGKGQSPRGLRNGAYRPQYIVGDDLDTDEEILNPRRVDKSVDWILRALLPCMDTKYTRFVLTNNRIGNYTILTNIVKNPRFHHRRVNALDENGNPSWAARYSIEYYNNMREAIGTLAFNSEYMNAPLVEGKIFRAEHIQFRKPKRLNQYERLVVHWDVAYSDSHTADCNAIVLSGLHEGKIDILKAFVKTCKMGDALRWMYWLQSVLPRTCYVEWYVESQFWNNAVDLEIQNVAKEMGYRLNLIFTERAGRGTNKFSRIVQMLPAFQRGIIYFNQNEEFDSGMQELIIQLKSIEPGYNGKDDGPDAAEETVTRLLSTIATENALPIIGQNQKNKRTY